MATATATCIVTTDLGFTDFTGRTTEKAMYAATQYALAVPGLIVSVIDARTGELVHRVTVDEGGRK